MIDSKRLEKEMPCSKKYKKIGVAILISDKKDFQTSSITKNIEDIFIIIKGSILS